MKKIAFILGGLGSGGIENYLLRFLKYSTGNIVPTVICTKSASGTLENDFRKLNIPIFTQKVNYFNLIQFVKLYKTLKKNKYDAICDFRGDFSAFVLLISKLAGVKNRIVFYRNSKYQFKMTLEKKLYIKLLKFALKLSKPKILSNSEYALDVYHSGWRQKSKENYKVIRNGIPYESFSFDRETLKSSLNIPENCITIGHVGNFREAKNHGLIVNIANSIVSEKKNIRFLLIGKGVEKGIEKHLKKKRLQEYFILPGIRKDIPDLLKLMDVFLFPSFDEGQPNALLEALLYEVPVFASNIPTIIECTPHEVRNNLFPPNDHIAFSNAVKEFIENGNSYNTAEVSLWVKNEFNPEIRFFDFLNELL